MIEIILLVCGIVYALRRPKLKSLTPGDYPDTPQEQFTAWRDAELRATDIFLFATWGAFIIKLLIIFAAISGGGLSADLAGALQIAVVVSWLAALTFAAILGSKAKKLRVAAGVKWP